MIGRRKKNLPKWRYDFNCRKCDNVQFINDPEHGRLGDYCVACVEAFDQGRPDPIHADDDRVVPPVNSTLYYNALKDNGVKASMHIYPTGGHGWGIRKNFKYREQWQQTVLDWLQGIDK